MARLFDRFRVAIKAFRSNSPVAFPGGYHGPGNVPGERIPAFIPADGVGGIINLGLKDADACAASWENSCVAICMNWIVAHFPEPDLAVERLEGKDWEEEEGHPLIALMDDPAPGFPIYNFHTLWAGALLPALADGNAYWLKGRDAAGVVRELWPVSHGVIEPVRLDPSRPDYLYQYTIRVANRPDVYKLIDPAEVVHFRWGLPDQANDLKSVAPLRSCLMEVVSDTEASRYTAAILRNRGIPGLMVVFDDDYPLTDDEADKIKVKVMRATTGANRGDPVVIGGKAKIESPSFKPSELAITEITKVSEARICSALGVPPMVVDLSVADTQKSYANQDVAVRKAWQNLRPLQNRMAEDLYRQLLPDFEPDRKAFRIVWSYDRVEALQEDRDAVSKRAIAEHLAGLTSQNEARADLGKPPVDGGDDKFWSGKNPNEGADLAQPGATPLRIAKGVTHADRDGEGPRRDLHPAHVADPTAGDVRDAAGARRLPAHAGGAIGRDPDADDRDPLEALAFRVLKQMEADHGLADPGGNPGLDPLEAVAGPPQIVDHRGRPVGAKGKPQWPSDWREAEDGDAAGIPADDGGDEGLAGDAAAGVDPGGPAEPGPPRGAAGGGPGGPDPAAPPQGGDGDAGEPGPADGLGAGPGGE